ncbi:hypothetical protein SAMN05216209_1880 [Pseudomonas nitroreducens]|nr:hypothetical protein SAMN05216209_1880 [Pseudomonas nitroreducens]
MPGAIPLMGIASLPAISEGVMLDKPPADPALPKCLSNEQAGVCRRTLYKLRAITSRCTSLVPS